MATQKNRIDTIVALIASNPAFSSTSRNKIRVEFKQVINVDKIIPDKRKNILKILHSTRALDSCLAEILNHHRIKNGKHSIGQYLYQFEQHRNTALSNISTAERIRFQNSIVKVRNAHLHQADCYPRNDGEVYTLVAEMQALLVRIDSL